MSLVVWLSVRPSPASGLTSQVVWLSTRPSPVEAPSSLDVWPSTRPSPAPSPTSPDTLPGLAEIWEEAKRVHHEAVVEIFGLEPAQVAAMYVSSLVSPYASPEPQPPESQPPAAPVPSPEGVTVTILFCFCLVLSSSCFILKVTDPFSSRFR